MALSEEEIRHQIDVLTKKTSENPDMVYKAIAALNKGLNPKYFTGNDTKIVNAINKLAVDVDMINDAIIDLINKTNKVLSDVHSPENKEDWEETKELMGTDNIIDGIKLILEGKKQDKILNLQADDIGKILSVSINDITNKPEVKPINLNEIIDVKSDAYDITYNNANLQGVTNVGEAIDVICENTATNISMDTDKISLKSRDDDELASLPLMNDNDVTNLISSLDN